MDPFEGTTVISRGAFSLAGGESTAEGTHAHQTMPSLSSTVSAPAPLPLKSRVDLRTLHGGLEWLSVCGRHAEVVSLAELTKAHRAGHWSRPWQQGCAKEQGHTQVYTVSSTLPSGNAGRTQQLEESHAYSS